MSERKDINKLFQEQFKDFEMIPDEMVWEAIEIKLKEKKKRRVLPFWWKLSGIAAALLVGFFIYQANYKPTLNLENGVASQKNDSSKTNVKSGIKTVVKPTNVDNNSVVVDEVKSATGPESNSKISLKEKNTVTNFKTTNNTSIAKSDNRNIPNSSAKISATKEEKIAYQSSKNQKIKSTALSEKGNLVAGKSFEEEKIAYQSSKNKIKKSAALSEKGNLVAGKSIEEEKIAYQSSKNKIKKSTALSENNNSVAEKSIEEEKIKTTAVNNNTESNNSVVKNSTENTGIVLKSDSKTQESTTKKIDSTKIAAVEPNALEELLKEKESKKITEAKINRWQVSSSVAPIYFSSISKGSPLDNKLADNDKSYSANNQSYGLGVNYAVNKKIKIRTGVNILNVDYTTNGIVYYQTPALNGKLANLNPNIIGYSITIENLSNVSSPFNKMTQKNEGSLNQKLGYIEMPLELTYKVLDKKLGIDFIGGMSTMIVNKNEIYLQSSDLNLKIGEANNLNNVHFSGNLGLGFKYNLLKHFEAHIEPVFKYQIKTFSNDAGNFKPYMFGVYSGINFSF